MIGKSTIHQQVVRKATKSNTLLLLLLSILLINYIIPDPIPLIDELLSAPIIVVILLKLLNFFRLEKNQKSSPKNTFSSDAHIEEGEIIE